MKKVLCLIGLIILMYTNAWAVATDFAGTLTKTDVWENGKEMTFVYASTDTVEVGTPEIFKIPALGFRGKISEVSFESSSTSWVLLLSRVDDELVASNETIISMTETSGTVYSPSIPNPVTYFNGVSYTTGNEFIFLTITPLTVNTGNWELTITFVRY